MTVQAARWLLLVAVAIAFANEGHRALDRQWRTYADIKIRWTEEVTDTRRDDLVHEFELRRSALDEGRVWSYRLYDPTTGKIARIVQHPSVADTAYVDRTLFVPERVDIEGASRASWWRRGSLWSLVAVAAAVLWNAIQDRAGRAR